MGQQQFLLIVLGVVITLVAIAAGLYLYQVSKTDQNKNAIINDLSNIASLAQQHRIRTDDIGGGGGTFSDFNGNNEFQIPDILRENGNAWYEIKDISELEVTFRAVSAINEKNAIEVTINNEGEFYNWVWEGAFGQ